MGQSDELGLSKTRALKLAHTQFNRVNEHTTLFTGTLIEPEVEPEGEADGNDDELGEITSETVKPRSYYGDYTMGPAVRSSFHKKTFPLAISFAIKEDIEDLSDSFILTTLDINSPLAFLNKKELREFQAAVQARSETPAFSPSDKVLPTETGNEKLYKPTDADVFIMIGLIVEAHPQTYLPLSKDKLSQLRDCLHFEMSWDISSERLEKLLMSRLRFHSIGSIPVESVDLAAIDAKEREYQAAVALPTRKVKEDKEPEVPWSEDQKKEYAKERAEKLKLIRKRLAAPKPTLADRLRAAGNFKQKEEAKAKITFQEDPCDRSFMRIRVTHMYKDESRPKDQPSHKTDIDLTYRNTRPRGQLPNTDGDRYDPSERIINVSDRTFIPYLDKIFPHLARNDEAYWDKCYGSLAGGHGLTLLQLRQNELPMTSNLFVDRDDIPTSYKDLQVVMRNAPIIFALVRGSDVEEITDSIMHRFGELAKYDPLSEFFVDKQNPFINDKGIKATPDLPKFSTWYENSFEDWREFSIHCGVGAIIELRFGMQQHIHRGKASAHSVPHTQYKYETDNESSIDLSMFLNFSEERPDKEIPRLAIGDFVTVDLNHYKAAASSEHLWTGKVVAPTLSTGIGQVCMIINRPMNKEATEILDEKSYTKLTAAQIDKMSVEALQEWSSENQSLNVTVMKEGEDKECKRLCNGLSNMRVPDKLLNQYLGKEHILSQFRLFMQCKDHTQYDASSLYDTIVPNDRNRFMPVLLASLHDYQQAPVTHWANNGVTANLGIIGGISGSGKTYVSISTLSGYTFKVKIDRAKRKMQELDLERLLASASRKSKNGVPPDDIEVADNASGETKTPGGASGETADDVEDEIEDGRVTHVCIQNETVDHSFETWQMILSGLCQTLGVPRKLIIRLHSIQAERQALCAMLDALFVNGAQDPVRYLHDETLRGKTNIALLEHYLREFRTDHPGITDKRYKLIQGSLAWVVLQLARVEGFHVTTEVANTWDIYERDHIAFLLRDIVNARRDINTEGRMSKETYKDVKAAFKIGCNIVYQRASVVCTTLSVATSSSFQMYRKAHAVALEEAGRAIDLDITALLSTHWACDFIMLVGDWRQLTFNPYGPELDNPFQKQLGVSPFARLRYTGFPMQLLTHTSRFTNSTLLDLCAHLNRETIAEVPGSFKKVLEQQAEDINRMIWGKKSVVVVVNTEHAVATRDATGSWYSVTTAIATMHDMFSRLRTLDGDNLLVITPYNAQLRLLRAFRDTAVRNALVAGNRTLATQLTKAMLITVDSSMGKDRDHVILDSVGHADGFLWQQPRTLVAGTRARSSFILIGPTYHYTSSSKGSKDRLKEMLYTWHKKNLIVTVDQRSMSKFEQYHDTQVALNVASRDDAVKSPQNYRQAPLGLDLTAEDYSDTGASTAAGAWDTAGASTAAGAWDTAGTAAAADGDDTGTAAADGDDTGTAAADGDDTGTAATDGDDTGAAAAAWDDTGTAATDGDDTGTAAADGDDTGTAATAWDTAGTAAVTNAFDNTVETDVETLSSASSTSDVNEFDWSANFMWG